MFSPGLKSDNLILPLLNHMEKKKKSFHSQILTKLHLIWMLFCLSFLWEFSILKATFLCEPICITFPSILVSKSFWKSSYVCSTLLTCCTASYTKQLRLLGSVFIKPKILNCSWFHNSPVNPVNHHTILLKYVLNYWGATNSDIWLIAVIMI